MSHLICPSWTVKKVQDTLQQQYSATFTATSGILAVPQRGPQFLGQQLLQVGCQSLIKSPIRQGPFPFLTCVAGAALRTVLRTHMDPEPLYEGQTTWYTRHIGSQGESHLKKHSFTWCCKEVLHRGKRFSIHPAFPRKKKGEKPPGEKPPANLCWQKKGGKETIKTCSPLSALCHRTEQTSIFLKGVSLYMSGCEFSCSPVIQDASGVWCSYAWISLVYRK